MLLVDVDRLSDQRIGEVAERSADVGVRAWDMAAERGQRAVHEEQSGPRHRKGRLARRVEGGSKPSLMEALALYCAHCGSVISAEDTFCRKCGAAQALRPPTVGVAEAAATAQSHLAIPLAVAGFIVGGLVGFMMRPSVLLIGQLPFGVVITRGANLSGLDLLLRSTAENSFNQMVFAAILGAVACGVAGFLIKTQPVRRR